MNTRDYFLRLIETLSRALAKIMGLKEKGQYTEALKLIQENYDTQLKEFDSEKAAPEAIDLLGQLKFQEAEIRMALHETDKSVILYQEAIDYLKQATELSQTFDLNRESLLTMAEEKITKSNGAV